MLTTCTRNKSSQFNGNMAACCECVKTVKDFVPSQGDTAFWNQSLCYVNYQHNNLNVTSLADRVLTYIDMPPVNDVTVATPTILTDGKLAAICLLTANGLVIGCIAPIAFIIYYYTKILNHVRTHEIRIKEHNPNM